MYLPGVDIFSLLDVDTSKYWQKHILLWTYYQDLATVVLRCYSGIMIVGNSVELSVICELRVEFSFVNKTVFHSQLSNDVLRHW